MANKILVTGATGYIGSHAVVELLDNGYEVVAIDNFSNSKKNVLECISKLNSKKFKFYEGDVINQQLLEKIFVENKIDAVIHFASYKAGIESVRDPLKYYQNNLESTITLLQIMKKYDCKNIIFSSSATVYGIPKELPLQENSALGPITPYGKTKLMIEEILRDLYISDNDWNITLLRYFNPIGNHPSGLIGENPNEIPNSLMPYIVRVANKEYNSLKIFGNDYDTKDGTGVRDYIHVMDLVEGHVKALEKNLQKSGLKTYNLGTGKGYSVLELIDTFEKANDVKIPYTFEKRREGDVASCYAKVDLANDELGWSAKRTLEDMCKDTYEYVLKVKEAGQND